ncbi:hypothetical protein M0R45_011231 [Rubus argutus]|uniref:Uncharacterized protein n=1 Tax=Rubus argutus TaxID=59490 RepID=A0AAW1YA60_RUBAR
MYGTKACCGNGVACDSEQSPNLKTPYIHTSWGSSSSFSQSPNLSALEIAGRDNQSYECESSESYLNLFVEETSFYNRIVLGRLLPNRVWEPLPHFFQSWLRNYLGGTLIYLVSGFLWSFYIYYLKRNLYVPKDAIPSNKAMLLQIYVAMKAMPWYCALPSISEYMQTFTIASMPKYGLSWVLATTPFIILLTAIIMAIILYGWTGCLETLCDPVDDETKVL